MAQPGVACTQLLDRLAFIVSLPTLSVRAEWFEQFEKNLREHGTLPRYIIKVQWLNWIWPDAFHLFDIYDAPLI